MPGLSHHRSLQQRSERHFFMVTGLPAHFNWQMLKDLVRGATTNQPGWTHIDEYWHGPEGAKGYFSVKSQHDADNVYDLLVRVMYARLGQPLLVHHFDASSPEPILVKCNCRSYYPGATGHSDLRSRTTTKSVLATQHTLNWQPVAPVPFVAVPMQRPGTMIPISVPQMPMYAPPVTYYQAASPMAASVISTPKMTNEHGLPINATNGVVRTKSRGLHISRLTRNASESELRELLRPYGRPLGVNLKRGHAVVQFGSAEEVRRAIEGLDKRMWKGRQIAVKEDRDSTAISAPVIVRSAPQHQKSTQVDR